MTDQRKESIIRKIKNLLDLSNDKNSKAEAEAAAKKAQALIMKYNVEQAELEGGMAPKIGQEMYEVWKIQKAQEGKWIRPLFGTIAKFNFCRVIESQQFIKGAYRDVIYILGEATNVEFVKFLTEQLIHRIRIIRKKEWEAYSGEEGYHSFLRGFCKGAYIGIYWQLKENQEEFAEEKSTAIVISKKNEAVEKFKEKEWPNLGKARTGRSSSRDGQRKGKQTGRNMNIQSGLRGSGGSKLLN